MNTILTHQKCMFLSSNTWSSPLCAGSAQIQTAASWTMRVAAECALGLARNRAHLWLWDLHLWFKRSYLPIKTPQRHLNYCETVSVNAQDDIITKLKQIQCFKHLVIEAKSQQATCSHFKCAYSGQIQLNTQARACVSCTFIELWVNCKSKWIRKFFVLKTSLLHKIFLRLFLIKYHWWSWNLFF